MGYEMSSADRQTIRSNLVLLVKNLNVDKVFVSYMVENDIFTAYTRDVIASKSPPQEKADHVVSELPRCGPKAFKVFIYALMSTEHGGNMGLARKLSASLAAQYQVEHPERHPVQVSDEGGARCAVDDERPCSKTSHPSEDNDDDKCQQTRDVHTSDKMMSVHPEDPKIQKLIKRDNVYNMSHRKRGRVLIINMNQDRRGATLDCHELINLFGDLQFDVKLVENKSRKELKSLLANESEDKYHCAADAFIMIVMAHGREGMIQCHDDKLLDINTGLVQPFTGPNCISLVGKPKIFLIQACQVSSDSQSTNISRQLEADCRICDTRNQTDRLNLSLDDSPGIHDWDDVLIEYSTVSGYEAYRDPEKGTFFIQSLVEVLYERAHLDHLCDMLKEVRRRVKETCIKWRIEPQLTETADKTSKHLYFFPGYTEEHHQP